MPLNPPDIKELKAIVDWVNLTDDVRELRLKYGDVELFISRDRQDARGAGPGTPAAVPTPSAAPAVTAPAAPVEALAPAATPAAPSAPQSAASMELASDEIIVKAPMVGIFYEAPKPGAPAFVEVGTRVELGSVLCIVEVMKLMNNIEAPESGTITKVLVENNQPVAFGQPLMVIKRDA